MMIKSTLTNWALFMSLICTCTFADYEYDCTDDIQATIADYGSVEECIEEQQEEEEEEEDNAED